MYLYYYFNEKYVGQVDIEVFFQKADHKTLVSCTEECNNLLDGLELMYGKRIERFTRGQAWDIKHHVGKMKQRHPNYVGLPPHMFTTKNCGKVLQWSEPGRALACRL